MFEKSSFSTETPVANICHWPLGGSKSPINSSEWFCAVAISSKMISAHKKCHTLPEPDRLFVSCADANGARTSLTSALVFFFFLFFSFFLSCSALLCSVCYFFFFMFIFNFFLSCANKVGFTKADLQGRRSNSASSEAPSPESLLCAMHCGCHHGNYIPLFLVQQRSPAPWEKKRKRERDRRRETRWWLCKLKKPFVTKVQQPRYSIQKPLKVPYCAKFTLITNFISKKKKRRRFRRQNSNLKTFFKLWLMIVCRNSISNEALRRTKGAMLCKIKLNYW